LGEIFTKNLNFLRFLAT